MKNGEATMRPRSEIPSYRKLPRQAYARRDRFSEVLVSRRPTVRVYSCLRTEQGLYKPRSGQHSLKATSTYPEMNHLISRSLWVIFVTSKRRETGLCANEACLVAFLGCAEYLCGIRADRVV